MKAAPLEAVGRARAAPYDVDIAIVGGPPLFVSLLRLELERWHPGWRLAVRSGFCEMEDAPRVLIYPLLSGRIEHVSAFLVWRRKHQPTCPAIILHPVDFSPYVMATVKEAHRPLVWLSLSSGMEDVVNAVRSILPDVRREVEPTGPAYFTPREQNVLSLLTEGKPNKIIAHELSCSENTVKVHLGNIMRKAGVRNRTQLALFYSPARTGLRSRSVSSSLTV